MLQNFRKNWRYGDASVVFCVAKIALLILDYWDNCPKLELLSAILLSVCSLGLVTKHEQSLAGSVFGVLGML